MKNLLLLLLFINSWAYSQKKKEYYLDENWKKISKQEFNKRINHMVNLAYYTENDTAFFGKLITRETNGKLKPEVMASLKKSLKSYSGKYIDTTKIIVINYYSGEEDESINLKSTANLYYKNYLKKLNKILAVEQFWIYKEAKNLKYVHSDRYNWIQDKDHIIEDTFFPLYFRFGSFAIIHPEGYFYTYFGEYGGHTVWDGLKEFLKKYGK